MKEAPDSPSASKSSLANPIKRDLAAAQHFWKAITGGAPATWQTLPDHPGSTERPQILHGPFAALERQLTEANAGGAAVSMMINAGNLQGRKTSNVTRTRALFVDLDGTPRPTDPALRPHLCVTTSPGRAHLYWLTDGIPLSEWPTLQRALATHFGGDEAVTDLPRAMRVPGFAHQKDPEHPHLVTLQELQDGPRYTYAEVLQAWPFLQTALEAAEARRLQAEQARHEAAAAALARPMGYSDPLADRRAHGLLQAHYDRVAAAQPGTRQATLRNSGRALGGYVAGGAVDQDAVYEVLSAAAATAGLDADEARRTIEWGLENGAENPLKLPESPSGRYEGPKYLPGNVPANGKRQ